MIDTGLHFRYQKSERAIGAAIKHLLYEENYYDFQRGEVFISTRIGHVQEDADFGVSFDKVKSEAIEKLGVKQEEFFGQNCLNPKFLAYQLEKSRANLGLETIDLVNLHNPENLLPYFDGKKQAMYEIVGQAFAELEEQRQLGKLKYYGMASYAAFRSLNEYHLSLEKLLEISEKYCGKDNGFKFITLPVNIVMPESFIEKTQTKANDTENTGEMKLST